MLSSVFSRRKNLQRRLNNLTHRTQVRRAHSPPSPASFASPDIFDPGSLYSEFSHPSQKQASNLIASQAPTKANNGENKRISSPQVELSFGVEETNLSDWFPADLLHLRAESEPMLRPERNASLGATSNASVSTRGWTLGNSSGSVLVNPNGRSIPGPEGLNPRATSHNRHSVAVAVVHDAEGEGKSCEEYNFEEDEVIVIGAPRGRDPTPSPLASATAEGHEMNQDARSKSRPRNASSRTNRRPAPSPIRIPKRSSRAHAQLQRSASLSSLFPSSRRSPSHATRSNGPSLAASRAPSLYRVRSRSTMYRSRSFSRPASVHSRHSDSELDWEDGLNSAVSGTTLARQLASTYILSPSPSTQRRSRGHLARQDSATLPKGEYNFLFARRSVRSSKSSASSRSRQSGVGETYWRDEKGAPPVPPMPEGLSPGVITSPLSQRSSNVTEATSPPRSRAPSIAGLEAGLIVAMTAHTRRLSSSSIHSRRNSYRESHGRRLTLDSERKRRRISKISEGSGSASASASAVGPSQSQVSLPFAGDREGEAGAEVGEQPSALERRRAQEEDDQGQEVEVSLPVKHSSSPDAPVTATSVSASVYSQKTHNTTFHGVPTPDSSSSASMYSAGSSLMGVLSPGGTSVSFTSVSSPQLSFKSPESTGATSSVTGSTTSFSPSRPLVSILPIGGRPRSAQVPQSPSPQSSRTSQDSIRPHSISLASLPSISQVSSIATSSPDELESPDLLDIMLFPSPRGAPTPPAPNSSTSTSSGSASSSSRIGSPPAPISVPPRRADGFRIDFDAHSPTTASAARQTFPETPYAFTPLTGKSFGSPALPPNARDVVPPLPRTTTLGRGARVPRGRFGGAREMRGRTLSSPPGKLVDVVVAPLPAVTTSEAVWTEGAQAPAAVSESAVADDLPPAYEETQTQLGTAFLPSIEERSAPSTPSSSRVASQMPTPNRSQMPSPNRSLSPSPSPLRPESPPRMDDERARESVCGDVGEERPASLAPSKRLLTPVPSPPASSIPLPPSPIPEDEPVRFSAFIEFAGSSSPVPRSRSRTPQEAHSPAKSSGILSRRPSGASESSVHALSQGLLGLGESTSTPSKRITRSRPPPPSGPRRPSTSHHSSLRLRARNGSVSSQTSTRTSRLPSVSLPGSSSPRFQTVPIRFRGLTMEVAQWTFTSQQLQEVVSAAIQQSADASAIRLLPMDMLTTQLPEEISRLEALSSEMRTSYKLAVRRRKSLLASLEESVVSNDVAAASRVLEEVGELTGSLDHYAEELHNVTDQLGQLAHLRDVHSRSALAMALRKLNTSFVKHLAEKEELRSRLMDLEHQRDEAWKQAEDAAQEVDGLVDKIAAMEGTSVPTPESSRRSSRVLTARKTSIRISKAGLRSPSRMRSQRSSRSSVGTAGSAGLSMEDIPPVPPIPIRSSLEAYTSALSSRSSAATDPAPEVRAMLAAHQELCAMLGISVDDLHSTEDLRHRSMSAAMESPGFGEPQSAKTLRRRNSDILPPSPRGWAQRHRSRSIDDKIAILAANALSMVSP